MIAVRGATTIQSNSKDNIKNASIELFDEILKRNNINLNSIVSILFSCTKDITMAYPGAFIREYFNLNNTAIMHFNEMEVESNLPGYLPLCIRVMIMLQEPKKETEFVYLNEAKNLRKDLFHDENKN